MRESIIQTTINKFLYWLAKRCVTALYKRTRFLTCSWGLDENTDLYLISEESYPDYHRFGLREEKYADTPQTTLCRECDDYAGDGMYCASNYLVRDFSTSAENCKANCIDKAKADIAERSSWSKTYEAMCEPQTDCPWK